MRRSLKKEMKKKIKKEKLILVGVTFLIAAGLFLFQSAQAQFTPQISIDNFRHSYNADSREFKASFSVENKENFVLTNLGVKIQLFEGAGTRTKRLIREEILKDGLTLWSQAGFSQEISFKIPENINSGIYLARISVVQNREVALNWQDATLSLKGSGGFLTIKGDTARVASEAGLAPASIGLIFKPSEAPGLEVEVVNDTSGEIRAVPKADIYFRNISGKKIADAEGEPVVLQPGEKKSVKLQMPLITQPGSYLAVLKFYNERGEIISGEQGFRWIIEGQGAVILGLRADQDSFKKDQVVKLSVEYAGPADFSQIRDAVLEVKAFDKRNNVCFEYNTPPITIGPAPQLYELKITPVKDCFNPRLEVRIAKSGQELTSYSTVITSQREIRFWQTLIFKIIFIAILILLGLYFIRRYYFKKRFLFQKTRSE